jgi:hypothetical protein
MPDGLNTIFLLMLLSISLVHCEMKKAHEKYNNTIKWEIKFQTPEYGTDTGIHISTVHKLACERKPNRFNTNSQKHK